MTIQPSRLPTPDRKRFLGGALLLVAPLLILSACGQPQSPSAALPGTPLSGNQSGNQTPAPTVPGTTGVPATPSSELRPLGMMKITFDGIGTDAATASAESLTPQGVAGQNIASTGGVQLLPVSSGSFVLGTRGAGGMRYLYATFKVRNASNSGVAYATPRTNLTLVAVSTPGTVGATALSSLSKFDNSAADPAIAPMIVPTHGMTFDRLADRAAVLSGAEDLQVYSEAEVAALALPAGATRVFPYGFVVRNPTTPASRALGASPAAGQFDGVVTIAMKLPLQASPTDDPFRFSLNVEAVDDSVTRVTESPEEQGATSGVASRASLLGAGTQVATLCGTTYAGTGGVFVGSATTAGAAGTGRLAHIGGNLALNALNLPNYPFFGNTAGTVAAAGGLLSNYRAYASMPTGTAAPLAAVAGTATTSGSTLSVNPDGSFSFTPKAGEGTGNTDLIGYTVSDGAGCTSPQLTANAPITGRVWYVKNDAGTAGDGRSTTPFQTLAAASAASSAGDTLYLYRGNGTTTNQASGIVLKANQRLIGSGVPLTLSGSTLQAADASGSPVVGSGSGAAITLATGNELGGLNVAATGTGIKGSNFGTLTSSAVSVSATGGPALDLNTGVLASTFGKLSSSASPGSGVSLVDTSGSLTVSGDGTASSGGVVSGAASSGVSVTGSTAMPNLSLNSMNITTSKAYGLLYQVPAGSTTPTSLVLNKSVLTDSTLNHVEIILNGSGNATYALTGNTLSNPGAGLLGGVEVVSSHSGAVSDQGRITDNTVTLKADPSGSGNGLAVYVNGAGTQMVQIARNTIENHGTYGIDLAAQQGQGTLSVTVSNNVIRTPAAQGLEGMRLNSGNATTGEKTTLCLNLSANTSGGTDASGQGGGYVVRQRPNNTYQLQGYAGAATDTAAIAAFIQSRELGGNKARIRSVAGVTGATCATPPVP